MYLKSSQYPALSGKSKAEQRKVVAAAIRAHNKYVTIRFFAVFVLLMASVPVVSHFWQPACLCTHWTFVWPIACGLIFSGYLLWEINGPVLRAVEQYLESSREHS